MIRKACSLIRSNGPLRQAKHKPVNFANIPYVFGIIVSDLGSVFFSVSAHVKHVLRAGFKWLQFSLWTQEGSHCQRLTPHFAQVMSLSANGSVWSRASGLLRTGCIYTFLRRRERGTGRRGGGMMSQQNICPLCISVRH